MKGGGGGCVGVGGVGVGGVVDGGVGVGGVVVGLVAGLVVVVAVAIGPCTAHGVLVCARVFVVLGQGPVASSMLEDGGWWSGVDSFSDADSLHSRPTLATRVPKSQRVR